MEGKGSQRQEKMNMLTGGNGASKRGKCKIGKHGHKSQVFTRDIRASAANAGTHNTKHDVTAVPGAVAPERRCGLGRS